MVRTVGNILVLSCIWASALAAHVQVRLRALDLNGASLQEATVGVPFKLEISLEGALSDIQDQKIDGIEAFTVTGRQTHLMNINNTRTTTTAFIVQTNKQGKYKIGPAHIVIDDTQYESDAITIKVGTQPVQKAPASNSSDTQVFMRLSCDKKTAVVGEKVLCTLSAYCAQENTNIQAITEPNCQGLRVKGRTEPTVKKEKVNGREYVCAAWTWELYPTQAGPLVIPALCGDFNIPMDTQNQNGFNMYNFFMGPAIKSKRAYSNAVTLDVMQLPASDKKAQAVGIFDSYSARLKPSKAQEGEGIVFTLTLEGTGDLSDIETPLLLNMPDELKWYESKQFVTNGDNGCQTKSFEYIIQGLKAGQWTIPTQSFFYFDIHAKKYTTLSTQSQEVVITPAAQASASPVVRAAPLHQQEELTQNMSDNELAPIGTRYAVYVYQERFIPWWLFAIILCFPMVLVGGRASYARLDGMRGQSNDKRKKNAFVHAKKALSGAQEHNDASLVYGIFIEFFAAQLGCLSTQISHDDIERYLLQHSFSSEQIRDWNIFLQQSSSAVYGNPDARLYNKHFYEQARFWLTLLQEKA